MAGSGLIIPFYVRGQIERKRRGGRRNVAEMEKEKGPTHPTSSSMRMTEGGQEHHADLSAPAVLAFPPWTVPWQPDGASCHITRSKTRPPLTYPFRAVSSTGRSCCGQVPNSNLSPHDPSWKSWGLTCWPSNNPWAVLPLTWPHYAWESAWPVLPLLGLLSSVFWTSSPADTMHFPTGSQATSSAKMHVHEGSNLGSLIHWSVSASRTQGPRTVGGGHPQGWMSRWHTSWARARKLLTPSPSLEPTIRRVPTLRAMSEPWESTPHSRSDGTSAPEPS